jgi:hypothetical protein
MGTQEEGERLRKHREGLLVLSEEGWSITDKQNGMVYGFPIARSWHSMCRRNFIDDLLSMVEFSRPEWSPGRPAFASFPERAAIVNV